MFIYTRENTCNMNMKEVTIMYTLILRNYKNIRKSEFAFEKGKVNFLFGISGSGKTSIAQALDSQIDKKYTTIGENIDSTEVLLNGKKIKNSDFTVFNENEIAKLSIYQEGNEDAYNLLFVNTERYDDEIREFENLVDDLNGYKNLLYEERTKINNLLNSLSIKSLTKKRELYKSSLPKSIQHILSETKSTQNLELAKTYGQERVKWIKRGTEFDEYKKHSCPFCDLRVIDEDRRDIINDISNVDDKLFKAITIDAKAYHDLNIVEPNYLSIDEVNDFTKTMIDYWGVLENIESILRFINLIDLENIEPKDINKINLSEFFTKLYPDVNKAIVKTNQKITEIKRVISQAKSQLKSVIRSNKEEINNNLERIGIDYHLEPKPLNPREKYASFLLVHNDGDKETDRVDLLSTGEKNLISLILFLIRNKNKNIIIDDPASSFDEFRRKSIFDLIIKYTNRTCIVLSHDQVFAKFATLNQYIGEERNTRIGKISYMMNYTGSPICKDVTTDDFGTLEYFVRKKLKNSRNYFTRVILIRLLCEIDRQCNTKTDVIYQYLSAILHKTKILKVLKLLNARGSSEVKVLNEINTKYGIKLEKMPPAYKRYKVEENISNFVKMIIERENQPKGTIKDEMSNAVHLNDSYLICLNPFKYDYFSKYVYKKLKD